LLLSDGIEPEDSTRTAKDMATLDQTIGAFDLFRCL